MGNSTKAMPNSENYFQSSVTMPKCTLALVFFFLAEPPPQAIKAAEAAANAAANASTGEQLDGARTDGNGPGVPADEGPFFFVGRRFVVLSILVLVVACAGLYAT